ncbi:uncharacterized protein LOC123527475 isoform X2 [Mercenaria mercenaria]|uniref:uncharacterized protein LOC123527475 isoform X2 n=1 Tax=Mercenaria mercenaria TaxID=6596 RepID=UPI00234E49A3|nr:uncharacterized protein LOC123527475 isoform X2 [Mercenaria mercenaria]
MADEDFDKDLYKNWVRGAKGLEYLQEGLQDFVGDKVQQCRNQSLQNITDVLPTESAHQCNECTAENLLPEHAKKKKACNRSTCLETSPNNCFGSKPNGRRKCPNGICSQLYDKIILEHSSRDPLWKNTDPSTWCSDPLGWSYGKCFQTTSGPGISASTTDAAGLLSILINNITLQNAWLACNDMSSKTTCPFNRLKNQQFNISQIDETKLVQNRKEDSYLRRKTDLRDDLVTFYKDRHSSIPLVPLFEEHDTPLVDFYVLPQINSIEVQKMFSGEEESNTPVKLSDMFKSGSKYCREIYLIADAGLGKTAFSKYLAVTWCQAHRPEEKFRHYFPEDAINAMREFDFLFLVLLRDSSEDCSIDDLIVNQIMRHLSISCTMTIDSLYEILHRERCLVILDGLDEWTHPEKKCVKVPETIPHRNARKKCTVLTTTRPWKLSVLKLKTSQIDKKVELVKLTSNSAQTLKERAISKIKDLDVSEAKAFAESLNTEIKEKQLENLESVPLLLMYLVCLWCDDLPLGRTKSELYTNIIELLLSRTVSKYPELETTSASSETNIPHFLSEHVRCLKDFKLLKALGQLAFETLFDEKRESTLVFPKSVTENFLNQSYLDLSLRSGILSQNTVQEKVTRQSSKVSFSHKTIHEYFCALHISCQNESDIKNIVQQNVNSLQKILDISKVFVFISGMNTESMSLISRQLMSVVNQDQITRTYRSMSLYDKTYVNPLKDIQNMYISCLKENTDNTSLCFEDVIIDRDYQKENHFLDLKWLGKSNKSNIQTILIKTGVHSLRELIDQYELDDLYSVKKIYYKGECKEAEIIRLLTNKSLECVTIISSTWQGIYFNGELSYCSSELAKTFQNISELRAIHINYFKMEYDVLKEFVNYIINRKSMAEIRLVNIHCVTHDISCSEMNLDFSQHSDLRKLALATISVSQLKVNVSSLEECNVGRLPKPGLVTSFLRELPAASKLHTFSCSYLKS